MATLALQRAAKWCVAQDAQIGAVVDSFFESLIDATVLRRSLIGQA